VRQFWQNLFPPPRRPVRNRDVAPLWVFAIVLAIAWIVVNTKDLVLFVNPKAFFLLLVLPWLWWQHVAGFHGLNGFRSVSALWTRFALATVLVLVLAEPRAVRGSDTLALVYALDVSDSVGDGARDAALEFVARTVSERPEGDEAGLIAFSRDAAVELAPNATFPLEALNTRQTRDGTSLEKGLSLAGAMLPHDQPGRIVLISDGTATEGNVSVAIEELAGRQIPVDVLPVNYAFKDEVWVEKLELPKSVKLGETYEAGIVIASLSDGGGDLILKENGEEIFRQTVSYKAGKNRMVLPIYMRGLGYYEYEAIIQPSQGRDQQSKNNTAMGYLYLKGEGRVLVVKSPDGKDADWVAFAKGLEAAGRKVEVVSAYEAPRDALALLPYDCIVFVNVAADAFDVVQLQAVHAAVHRQGSGLLMIGGQNSFGPGGYHRTVIEEALPVSMDISQRKQMPKGALAIILHTCEFPQGNDWGKKITKQALSVLSKQDDAGVLIYDWQGGEKWLFPLTPLSELEQMKKDINGAQIGDMPSFVTTMQLGLDGLKASDAAAKHMIIISDGDPSPPPPPMVNDFIANQISISMVAVFPHGGNDISVMQAVASSTGGRYYFPQSAEALPSIFIKEAKTLQRTLIQNKTFVPEVHLPSPVLKGIDSMPELDGYVLTTAKPRAVTVLRGPDEEDLDPILAIWRFGLGKTAAFTSDLSPNWGKNWVGWDHYIAFIKQLVTDISRVERKSNLYLSAFASGNTGVVQIEDHAPDSDFLEISATVQGPQDREEAISLRQTGPRRYEGEFPLWGKGRYHILAAGGAGERVENSVGGFVVAYSPEYLRFRSNPIVLNDIADRTGGRILQGQEKSADIFPAERPHRISSASVVDWFLIILACLLPLDVASRRIQIDWALVRGWFGGRRRESNATLGSLLERKKEAATHIPARPARPNAPATPVVRSSQSGAKSAHSPTSQASATPPPESGDDASTAGRLLARKRKWKEKDD
jgi:Ca-activated chloride channel homolog